MSVGCHVTASCLNDSIAIRVKHCGDYKDLSTRYYACKARIGDILNGCRRVTTLPFNFMFSWEIFCFRMHISLRPGY